MKSLHTVLIGSAGTSTAFGAITALRRRWSNRVRIVAMDINPRHLVTASVLSDVFEQVPLTATGGFSDALVRIVREHGVDTYLPLLPEEIALAVRLRDAGHLPSDLVLLAGSAESGAMAADKLQTARWLDRSRIAGPRTAIASEAFSAERYFLKPRSGTGSRGARVVTSGELHDAVKANPSGWVVQEICEGPEITVDAFFDPATGFCAAIARERIEIKAGVSTKARLFSDEKLERMAVDIARALPFSGSFCFQVMHRDGGAVVIDINPRPGAATAMCALAGNDFFAATFARAWGEKYSELFQPLTREVFVTRQYAEFITG